MNWGEAVEAMKVGHRVNRRAGIKHKSLGYSETFVGDAEIIDAGTEPLYLCAGWTDDNRPVRIFMGAWSKGPFVPDDEHLQATDWVVDER